MTRVIKPATLRQVFALAHAIELLRTARGLAEEARSPRATAAIRRALKSVEGAQRHVRHRRRRTEESAP